MNILHHSITTGVIVALTGGAIDLLLLMIKGF